MVARTACPPVAARYPFCTECPAAAQKTPAASTSDQGRRLRHRRRGLHPHQGRRARRHASLRRSDADAAPLAAVAVVPGLDSAAIDALYPKFLHVGSGGHDDDGPCAICFGDALRRRPGCGHCFHACCAERWLRVSATCPV
ncbi:hypothetical protein EJB05_55161, partial [Eragrostis curvula]